MRLASTMILLLAVSTGRAQPPDLTPPSPSISGEEKLIRELAESLADSDPEVRIYVAAALSKFGAAAVPTLVSALRDANPDRRAGAAYALAQMKFDARAAIPALTIALKDSEVKVRRQAAYAISRIVDRPERTISVGLPETPVLPGGGR